MLSVTTLENERIVLTINRIPVDIYDLFKMTAFIAFFQAMRQGIIARWSGLVRSEALKSTGKQRIVSNSTSRSSAESTAPRTAGTQASAATKKKTIDDWDYEVLQLITAWH
jgi:hypothetical protein